MNEQSFKLFMEGSKSKKVMRRCLANKVKRCVQIYENHFGLFMQQQ